MAMLTDRDEFAIGFALVGVAAAILATATATSWGIPVSAVLIVVMAVRGWWRSMPAWLLLLSTALLVVVTEAAEVGSSGYFVVIVALVVTVANGLRPFETVLAVAVLLSPLALWLARVPDYVDLGPWTWMAGLALGWLFGAVVGRQWELIDELNATRDQLAEAAAGAERQRIAREMHDVVGHSFSVVLLHLAGARTVLESDPARAADALLRAEDVGRRGMEDLRQTIGLMRAGKEAALPVPDLADLDVLVGDYRSAGMTIHLAIDPEVDAVGGAARIVTHDVVRESLTNCAKHAPASEVHVAVAIRDDLVIVRIANDAPLDRASAGVGTGISGLRQRVEALGGDFRAGVESSAWVVRAEIPRHLHLGDDAPGSGAQPTEQTSVPAT